MITRSEALAIVSVYWNATVERDSDEFHPASVELTPERDYWIIHGNSKAWLVHGDTGRMHVGISAFIVDADTGTLLTAGSSQNYDDILQDCRDDKVAAGKHYVLAGGNGKSSAKEISALRKLFPIGVIKARQFLEPPKRYWFIGKRRILLFYQRELNSIGMPSEIVLLDQAPEAVEASSQGGFSTDLSRLAKQSEAEQDVEYQDTEPPRQAEQVAGGNAASAAWGKV